MNTQSIDIFNNYLGENETLLSELQNAPDKKTFVDLYVNSANKLLAEKGLKTISEKEIETALPNEEFLSSEEINDFQMSTASAHTQASCTTSTGAGCTC